MGPDSVVIPAYNEGAVIDRCLASIGDPADLRVIVAANGCTDGTACSGAPARRPGRRGDPGISVPALNAGDEAPGARFRASTWMRTSSSAPGALYALVRGLEQVEGPAVAMPRLEIESREVVLGGAVLLPRLLQASRTCPKVSWGRVLRRRQRRQVALGHVPRPCCRRPVRAGTLRSVRATDVRSMAMTAHAPRTLSGLLKVRTRTYIGNRQADQAGLAGTMTGTASGTIRALARLILRQPSRLPDAAVYILLNLVGSSACLEVGRIVAVAHRQHQPPQVTTGE